VMSEENLEPKRRCERCVQQGKMREPEIGGGIREKDGLEASKRGTGE
jgi:hypothetical protein